MVARPINIEDPIAEECDRYVTRYWVRYGTSTTNRTPANRVGADRSATDLWTRDGLHEAI